jgi:2'-5' RNA ligase
MAGNLFYGFAILNAKVQASLEQLVTDLRDTVPRATWTGPDKWHVTTLFLGDVPVDYASDNLMGLQFQSFSAEVKGMGYFVNSKGPRVLYAELTQRVKLQSLYEALGGKGRYNPHLTVAKLEGKGDYAAEFADIAKNMADHEFGPILVQSVKLYQTQGGGLPYKVLAERRLTGETT